MSKSLCVYVLCVYVCTCVYVCVWASWWGLNEREGERE
jgi:hypothetical protein